MFFPIENFIRKRLNAFQAVANSQDGRDDGWFLENSILWGQSLGSGSSVSRGFKLSPIARHDAPVDALIKDRSDWQSFYRTLTPDEVLQIHLFQSSDYSVELEHYEKSGEGETNPWVNRVRAERIARVRRSINERSLVKPSFYGFISRALPYTQEDRFAATYRATSDALASRIAKIPLLVPEVGVKLMDDTGHRNFVNRVMNPAYTEAEMTSLSPVEPYRSIFEQTVGGPMHGANLVGVKGEVGPAALHFGGHHHAYIVVRELPTYSNPLILSRLVECGVRNIHATATIRRRDTATLKAKIANEIKKLENTLNPVDTKGVAKKLDSEVRMKAQKDLDSYLSRQKELLDGLTSPFDYCLVVRTWAKDPIALENQLAAIRAALESVNGVKAATIDNRVSASKFFFTNLAGNFNAYGHWNNNWMLYAESVYLPDLVPLFGAFLGNTAKPKMFFDGSQGNLVGIDLFPGGIPQNLCIFGATRSGKSNTVEELLSQIANIDFMGIIDNGNTHGGFVKVQHGVSIQVSANTGQCFNPLDTFDQVFTADHLSSILALIREMGARDLENWPRVKNIYEKYITYAYETKIRNLIGKDRKREVRLQTEACAFHGYLKERQAQDSDGTIDVVYADFKAGLLRQDPEIAMCVGKVTQSDVALFIQHANNRIFYTNYAIGDLSRQEAVQLGEVRTIMSAAPDKFKGLNPETVADCAAVLDSFCAGGSNGTLFDGVANVDINNKIVQFELGAVGEKNQQLLSTVQHLIFTFIRAKVVGLSRAAKKVIVVEELAKILTTEVGPTAYAELLAQMPKFNALVIGVLQNLAQLDDGAKSHSGVSANTVLAGQKAFMILRQDNAELVERLAHVISLPPSCVKTILEFRSPNDMEPANAFASFLYFQKSGSRPIVGVCQVRPNPETMFVAASNGEEYARRIQLLRGYPDMLKGVIAEARKERPYLYPRQFALEEAC
jgi:hypothetical protein